MPNPLGDEHRPRIGVATSPVRHRLIGISLGVGAEDHSVAVAGAGITVSLKRAPTAASAITRLPSRFAGNSYRSCSTHGVEMACKAPG